jgi:hypothetical protein
MKSQLEGAKHLPVTIDGTRDMGAPTPPKIKLNTLEDLRRETARVYRDARGGRIDVSEAARFTYILIGIGKFIEAADLEKRVTHMERKLLK